MFNRLALMLTVAASATAGEATVEAVRHRGPAPSEQRSVDRGMDPPGIARRPVSVPAGCVGDPRAPPPGACPTRSPPPAGTPCARGSAWPNERSRVATHSSAPGGDASHSVAQAREAEPDAALGGAERDVHAVRD